MLNIKSVEFNSDLDGFVVTLEDDRIVQVQFEQETNRLSGDYNLFFPTIDKENDYGLDLTDEEETEFESWMRSNKEIMDYSKLLDLQSA